MTYLRHTQFFRANSMQIKFNILQVEQVDSRLHPSLSLSRISQSTCGKSNRRVTHLQVYLGGERHYKYDS